MDNKEITEFADRLDFAADLSEFEPHLHARAASLIRTLLADREAAEWAAKAAQDNATGAEFNNMDLVDQIKDLKAQMNDLERRLDRCNG